VTPPKIEIDAAPIEAFFLMIQTAFSMGGQMTMAAPDHLVDIRRDRSPGRVCLVVYPSVQLREWAAPILEGASV